MRRQDIPTTNTEIETLLSESRQALEAAQVPDVAGVVRSVIVRRSVSSGVGVGRQTIQTSDVGSGGIPGSVSPMLTDQWTKRSRRSEILRFAAGLVLFALIAGGLALLFRPSEVHAPGSDQSASGATAVEPKSPFPVLAVFQPADSSDTRKLIQPVDPQTLEPLPGYEPIEIDTGEFAGDYVEQAISPDGSTAALVVHTPGDPISSMDPGMVQLHIVDLVSWTDSVVAEWPPSLGYSSAADPVFSADGSHIYWTVRTPGTGERTLARYDLENEVREDLATLPQGFVVSDYRISPDESTWYVFGVPVQQNLPVDNGYVLGEFTSGDAQVLIVDLGTGEITNRIELEGVATGGVPIDGLEGDGYPLLNASPGLDWDLAAQRLYVGQAEAEGRATVVNLNSSAVVNQLSLDEGASWLDRLAHWLFPSAQAIARAVAYGYALRLGHGDLVAFSSAVEELDNSRQELELGAHLPVWAVDVESGRQVWQSHLGGVFGISLTADESHLLVHSASEIFPRGPISPDDEHALFLLDIDSGDIAARLDLPGRPAAGQDSMVVSNDLIYIRTEIETGRVIFVVDPDNLSIVGTWRSSEGDPSIYKLIPLP